MDALYCRLGIVQFSPKKPFTWASGIQSPIYCDNRLLLSHPKALQKVIQEFCKLIKKKKIRYDAIAGVATAGIPYASILAHMLDVPLLYVRPKPKDHGKGNQIEGRGKKGARVLVIEDLISTGQSSLQAVGVLRKEGYRVTDCLAVFTYGFPEAVQAFEEASCHLRSLLTLESLLPVVVKKKILKKDEVVLLKKFISNPRKWNST